jgi:hypothetical protein
MLLQMERAEDVEDFGALDGAPPEATDVNLVLPSGVGEGLSAVPMPTVVGEDPVSAPTLTV